MCSNVAIFFIQLPCRLSPIPASCSAVRRELWQPDALEVAAMAPTAHWGRGNSRVTWFEGYHMRSGQENLPILALLLWKPVRLMCRGLVTELKLVRIATPETTCLSV